MALYGIEAVLGDVLNVLKAGMTTELAALEAEYADAVTLDAPSTTTGYWCEIRPPMRDERLSISNPGLIIFPLEDSPAGQPMGQYEMAYRFVVCPILQSSSVHEMSQRLYRYVRAVKELLCAPGQLTCGKCDHMGTDWRERELELPNADYTLQARVVGFSVTTYENV